MRPPSGACSWLKRRSFSLMAVYMRTGALTRPNEILPVQTARGRFDAGMACKDTPKGELSLLKTPGFFGTHRSRAGSGPRGQTPVFALGLTPVGGALLPRQQREHAGVLDEPHAVVLAPEQLDHARLAVVQVQVQERAVGDRPDQLDAGGPGEQRLQLVVAGGEVGREVCGDGVGVAAAGGGLEGAGAPLHGQLDRRSLGHRAYLTESTISRLRLGYLDRYSARSAFSRSTQRAYSSARPCAS